MVDRQEIGEWRSIRGAEQRESFERKKVYNSFKYCKEIKYINAVNCPVDLAFRSSLGTLLKTVSIVCGVVKHSRVHFIIVSSSICCST